jgi:crotonobetainyl-CoA:carnitine CoA-transferase CaiB-like acyl-CoA transferase
VIVALDAWGHAGPWAQRRGFDSVVQAATGIAVAESSDADHLGALPCQLLDHGTGYLAAAAALDGLRRQAAEGGSHVRRLSLARTATWLATHRAGTQKRAADEQAASDFMQEVHDDGVAIQAVRPPGSINGRPLLWPDRITRYGSDPARWAT